MSGMAEPISVQLGGGAKGGEGGGEEGGLGACKRTLGTPVCRRVLPQEISKSILHIYVILKQNKMSSQQKVGIQLHCPCK